jgi:hypothetical protein
VEELLVSIHMHTHYSDGTGSHADLLDAAMKAKIDAIIVTDHNVWVQDMETYLQKGRKRVLMLVGEEIHDPTRSEPGNHLLAIGANRELARFAPKPQQLIDQINAAGGMSFIAHPIEDDLPAFNEKAYNWDDWSITGFTGIELWNQLSEFKTRSKNLLQALRNALFPQQMNLGPKEETLKLWDELLASKPHKIVAIAGVDAHAIQYRKGLFRVTLYPYEFHFKSLTNHLIVPRKLSGEINADRSMILDALRAGHSFLAYEVPMSARGFRFTVNSSAGQFWMGDTVTAEAGLTFQIRLPIRTHVRLIKDGIVIKEHYDREVLTHITKEPGIYRAEVYIDYLGRHRAWIFSNPIYAV